jgi:hypothetical protein
LTNDRFSIARLAATGRSRLSGQSASRLVDNSRLAWSIAPARASGRAPGRTSSKSGCAANPRTTFHFAALTCTVPLFTNFSPLGSSIDAGGLRPGGVRPSRRSCPLGAESPNHLTREPSDRALTLLRGFPSRFSSVTADTPRCFQQVGARSGRIALGRSDGVAHQHPNARFTAHDRPVVASSTERVCSLCRLTQYWVRLEAYLREGHSASGPLRSESGAQSGAEVMSDLVDTSRAVIATTVV